MPMESLTIGLWTTYWRGLGEESFEVYILKECKL